MSYYTVVTHGSHRAKIAAYRTSLEAAVRDANSAKGTGTCSAARVYECNTLKLAKTADIGTVRSGERIVYNA